MSYRTEKIQYQVFDWLRFPLIILVIYNHSLGEPINYSAIQLTDLTGQNYYDLLRLSILILMQIAVPCFFFISGYLFFNKLRVWNTSVYYEKLKKRAKTILLPFLIWNSICIIYEVQNLYRLDGVSGISSFIEENGYWHLYWDSLSWGHDKTNWFGIKVPLTSPYLGSLWYLRDLMVMMILSPCFYYLFKYTRVGGLLLLLTNYVTGMGTNLPGLSTTAILFYGAGVYFNLKQVDVTKWSWKYRYLIYFLAVILWIADVLVLGKHSQTGLFMEPFFVIIGCLAVFNLAAEMIGNGLEIPHLLAQSSFFIYVSHAVVLTGIIVRLRQQILGMENPMLMSLGYIASPWIIAAICFIVYILLKGAFPKLCAILAGGR